MVWHFGRQFHNVYNSNNNNNKRNIISPLPINQFDLDIAIQNYFTSQVKKAHC